MKRFSINYFLFVTIAIGNFSCSPEDDSVERLERNCSLDGVYSCELLSGRSMTGWVISRMTKIASLSPSGGNEIDIDMGDLGPQGFRYRIYRDPVTNKLRITSAPGAAGSPYAQLDASLSGPPIPGWPYSGIINNTYDPTTCTFYIRCGYVGGSGWTIFEEVLRKQ